MLTSCLRMVYRNSSFGFYQNISSGGPGFPQIPPVLRAFKTISLWNSHYLFPARSLLTRFRFRFPFASFQGFDDDNSSTTCNKLVDVLFPHRRLLLEPLWMDVHFRPIGISNIHEIDFGHRQRGIPLQQL